MTNSLQVYFLMAPEQNGTRLRVPLDLRNLMETPPPDNLANRPLGNTPVGIPPHSTPECLYDATVWTYAALQNMAKGAPIRHTDGFLYIPEEVASSTRSHSCSSMSAGTNNNGIKKNSMTQDVSVPDIHIIICPESSIVAL
jgi:hypothetical protein